jgi:aminomethyltransferase
MTEETAVGELKRTGFADIHEELGAKMVPFAGFLMPIQYSSITAEHKAVREAVGVFDVSHMGEFMYEGPRALEAIQRVTVNDAGKLETDQAQYTAMTNLDGGIVDDALVYRLAKDRYMMVVNGSNIEKDWNHVSGYLPVDGVNLRDESDAMSLLAVQGPSAAEVVASITDVGLDDVPYYWMREGRIAAADVIVSRTGYTGEDGFELYFERGASSRVWEAVMKAGEPHGIVPCGLAARDTLRLEMKLALYGNDIDESTNPYEAGLGWIVKLDKGDFVGREALEGIKRSGPTRKLVGFRLLERGIPRPHYPILQGGVEVAQVMSGTMSPSLGYGIGTCYLPVETSKPGNELEVMVRDRGLAAEVVPTPFYKSGSLKR